MFPQLKKFNNESGIVLFIILMTAIIIMIFSVGILTQSMNENNYAQQQVDQVICDQLIKELYANAYSSGNLQNVGISTVMQGRNYQVTLNNYGLIASGADAGSYNLQTTCNYDTFQ